MSQLVNDALVTRYAECLDVLETIDLEALREKIKKGIRVYRAACELQKMKTGKQRRGVPESIPTLPVVDTKPEAPDKSLFMTLPDVSRNGKPINGMPASVVRGNRPKRYTKHNAADAVYKALADGPKTMAELFEWVKNNCTEYNYEESTIQTTHHVMRRRGDIVQNGFQGNPLYGRQRKVWRLAQQPEGNADVVPEANGEGT